MAAPGSAAEADEATPAAGAHEQPAGVSIFIDNDYFLFNAENEDRSYTAGLALEARGAWIGRRGLDWPRRMGDRMFGTAAIHERMERGGGSAGDVLQVGVSAFTPDELRDPNPQPDDRPYASILYLISRRLSVRPDERLAFTTETSLALLGLGLTKWFQTELHEFLRDDPDSPPYVPRGWHLQISDGGEPTARFAAKWQGLLLERGWFDAQWIADGNVGYYTNVGIGGALRVGRIRSPWWSFGAAPIKETALASNSAPASGAADAVKRRHEDFEIFAWAGGSSRAWAYNSLLQGQFRHSAVTVHRDSLDRVVGEYQAGVTVRGRMGDLLHSLSYAYARRSPEFKGPGSRHHSWAGIYYSCSRRFGP